MLRHGAVARAGCPGAQRGAKAGRRTGARGECQRKQRRRKACGGPRAQPRLAPAARKHAVCVHARGQGAHPDQADAADSGQRAQGRHRLQARGKQALRSRRHGCKAKEQHTADGDLLGGAALRTVDGQLRRRGQRRPLRMRRLHRQPRGATEKAQEAFHAIPQAGSRGTQRPLRA